MYVHTFNFVLNSYIPGKVFGPNFAKTTKQYWNSPSPMVIYCHHKDSGFTGFDLGASANVCTDFSYTPTDSGICLSKNLDLTKILKQKLYKEYEVLFESNKPSSQKIEKGTTWGEVSLLIQVGHDHVNERSVDSSREIKSRLT